MTLHTPRLTLRPLRADHAEALHGLMSDAEIMAFWDIAEVDDVALTITILHSQLEAMARGRALYWAMIGRDNGAFVGCCDLFDVDHWHHRAEVGFALAKPFWGAGYAFEAMRAVISHAAGEVRLKRLSARTHLGNVRSTRLLERLGFQEEGVLRGYVERGGARRDCQIFGLLL
jgi:ribosomal-protein-alanine N-acetyltransferase